MMFDRRSRLATAAMVVFASSVVATTDTRRARADPAPPPPLPERLLLEGDVTGAAAGGVIATTVNQLSGVSTALGAVGMRDATNLPTQSSVRQVQGGTLGSPANELAFVLQPRDPNKAPFCTLAQASLFNSTMDSTIAFGYNPQCFVAPSEPQATMTIEEDYEASPGVHWIEHYFQVSKGSNANGLRPFYYNFDRSTARSSTVISSQDGTDATMGTISLVENSTNYSMLYATPTQVVLKSRDTTVQGDAQGVNIVAGSGNVLLQTQQTGYRIEVQSTVPDDRSLIWFIDSVSAVHGTVGYYGNAGLYPSVDRPAMIVTSVIDDLVLGAYSSTGRPAVVVDGTSGNIQLLSPTAAKSFGGGAGVIGLANATTTPTANPSGGVVEYASNGGDYVRGSGGATTTTAPAGGGTVGTQSFLFDHVVGVVSTPAGATTPATVATIALATHHALDALIRVTGRCTADSSTPGMRIDDVFSTAFYTTWKNKSGTPERVDYGHEMSPVEEGSDPSMASSSVSMRALPGAIAIQVVPAATRWRGPSSICPIDWQVDAKPDVN